VWRGLRKGRVWILGILGLLLLSFWIVGGSESFQSCREGNRADFQDAGFHKAAAIAQNAEDGGDSVQSCLDYFLEQNESEIAAFSILLTALFTGVLAVSTIGLWQSTKELHEETRRLASLAEIQSKLAMDAAQKPADTTEPSALDPPI
jgi:hypothetical protein